jgi:hypothetical protein
VGINIGEMSDHAQRLAELQSGRERARLAREELPK